jgi:hypothetical protein
MTVETHSISLSPLSSGETARLALRLMTSPEPKQLPAYGRMVQEAKQDGQPQEPPPFRWPRIFPGL